MKSVSYLNVGILAARQNDAQIEPSSTSAAVTLQWRALSRDMSSPPSKHRVRQRVVSELTGIAVGFHDNHNCIRPWDLSHVHSQVTAGDL